MTNTQLASSSAFIASGSSKSPRCRRPTDSTPRVATARLGPLAEALPQTLLDRYQRRPKSRRPLVTWNCSRLRRREKKKSLNAPSCLAKKYIVALKKIIAARAMCIKARKKLIAAQAKSIEAGEKLIAAQAKYIECHRTTSPDGPNEP